MKLRTRYLVCAAVLGGLLLIIIGAGWTEPPRAAGVQSVPILVALSPPSVAAGAPAFTLTIDGAGFASSTYARWSGARLATTVVSDSMLRAQIPAANVAEDGFADVTAVTPAFPSDSPGVSNILVFRILPPQ
jgi:hypothetical protein